MYILGPVSSWIVNKPGLRLSTVLAAVPISVSLLVTSFMRDLDLIFVTFSIPFGLGASVLLITAVKVICVYFDKWLSFAYGTWNFHTSDKIGSHKEQLKIEFIKE